MEISEAAKKKARGLSGHDELDCCAFDALAQYIQQVSDAANAIRDDASPLAMYPPHILDQFILPDPVDPVTKPLGEALAEAYRVTKVMAGRSFSQDVGTNLRAELEKHGLTIVATEDA